MEASRGESGGRGDVLDELGRRVAVRVEAEDVPVRARGEGGGTGSEGGEVGEAEASAGLRGAVAGGRTF